MAIVGGIAASAAGSMVSSAMSDGGGGGGGGSAAGGAAQAIGGVLAARDAENFGMQVANTADPFMKYRSSNASEMNKAANTGASPYGMYSLANIGLAGMLQNPNAVFDSPVFQAQQNQGSQTLQRAQAAKGQSVSGNEMQELQQYGQTNAADFYNKQMSNLSGLSSQYFGQGAMLSGLSQANLGASAAAQSNIYGNVNSAYNAAGQGLGQMAGSMGNGLGKAIGNGFGSMFSGGGSGYNGEGGSSFANNPFGNQGTSYGGLGSGFYDSGYNGGWY